MAPMPYVALKRLRVGDDYSRPLDEGVVGVDSSGDALIGQQYEPLFRQPGEHVPEADAWPNVDVYVRNNYLAYVTEESLAERTPVPTPPAPPAPVPTPPAPPAPTPPGSTTSPGRRRARRVRAETPMPAEATSE